MQKENGFFKNIANDYQKLIDNLRWKGPDHLMWTRESDSWYGHDYETIAPFYLTGFYTPENTKFWQIKVDKRNTGVSIITDQIPVIDSTITVTKLDPGCTLPWHRDRFYLLKTKRPDYQEKKFKLLRYLIFLEDWKLGHFVQLENQVVTHWKSGDCWYFCENTFHLGTNSGLAPFISMQVSGFTLS